MCESTTGEEMAAEVLHPQNGAPDSIDSDYSFIPDPSSVNDEIEDGTGGGGSFNMANLQLALSSATPDLSMEELQSRIVEVAEDNVALREALKRNNEMMEKQLSTVSAWHNQMRSSMSKQQFDLKEAGEKMLALEKENSELHSKLKEMETMPKDVVDKETTMRDEVTPINDEEGDFEIVNRKGLKSIAEGNKLQEAEYKIAGLQKLIEYEKNQIAEMQKKYDSEGLKEKCSELPAEMVELLERFLEFRNFLNFDMLQEQEEKLSKMNQTQLRTEKENYREAAKMYNEKYNSYIVITFNFYKQLDERMKELENSVTLAQAELEKEKSEHAETQKQLNSVQTNYDRVTKLLQIQLKEEKPKNDVDAERERDTKMYLEQIDSVTAQLFDTEQKLQEQENQVKSLSSELNMLKQDSENIPILKAQIEVYKMDMNGAVLARDAAQEDVNRLTKQLHDMPSVSLCDGCEKSINPVEGNSRGKSKKRTTPNRRLDSKQNNGLYICPICDIGFTTLEIAETHANECIDSKEKTEDFYVI